MNYNQLKNELNKIKTNTVSPISRKEMINYLMYHINFPIEFHVSYGIEAMGKYAVAYEKELWKKPIKELQGLYDECYTKHKDDPPVTMETVVEMLFGRSRNKQNPEAAEIPDRDIMAGSD